MWVKKLKDKLFITMDSVFSAHLFQLDRYCK